MTIAIQGLVSVKSTHSVDDSADKLETILDDKDMNLLARIEHAKAA